jgi:hypothetical protein
MSLRSVGDEKPSRLESSYRRAHAAGHNLTRDFPLAASPPPGARSWLFAGVERLIDGEVAIGAVRNHRLTRLKAELGAIELY